MLRGVSIKLAVGVALSAVAGPLAIGCSNSSSSSSSDSGPVQGPADNHCGTKVQPTSQDVCDLKPGQGGGGSGGGGGAGGAASGGIDYGPTLYNSEGDDDDCKYHVKWSSTDIAENKDVTFTVVVTNKTDGSPTIGAATYAEVYLDAVHPATPTDQKTTEDPPGTYAVGPIRFPSAGKWTSRFHFFETCTDVSEESPHGHAAFFVQVP